MIPQSQKNRTFTIFILQTKIAFYCGDVSLGSKLLTLLHKMTDMLDDKRMTAHPSKSDVRPFRYIVQFAHLIFVDYADTKHEISCNIGCSGTCGALYWVHENKTTAAYGSANSHRPAQVTFPPTQRLTSHRATSIPFCSSFGKTGN